MVIKDLDCNNSIRNRGLKQLLCLGKEETFYEVLRQTIRLEIMKHTVKSFVRIQNPVLTHCGEAGHSASKR
jgi:hypothetical protein